MPNELPFELTGRRVWVAGHTGLVGGALVRRLRRENCELVLVERDRLDLRDQLATRSWVAVTRPDVIIIAAATVGGILANSASPADFLFDNLLIEANVIETAHRTGVSKLLFLGSSCIYPKLASQPIAEEALLTGALESTNEWYAIAKIAGLKLCQAFRRQHGCDFISAMPTNLYGPGDNFDQESSHVIPSLLRKAHEAKVARDAELVIWGTGSIRREFLHVDDCADACVHLLKYYSDELHINVGCGSDLTVLELAELICNIVEFTGSLQHDLSKPEGAPQKLLNVDRITSLGWRPRIALAEGLRSTYDWFKQEYVRNDPLSNRQH